jgi:hypothetical protein
MSSICLCLPVESIRKLALAVAWVLLHGVVLVLVCAGSGTSSGSVSVFSSGFL